MLQTEFHDAVQFERAVVTKIDMVHAGKLYPAGMSATMKSLDKFALPTSYGGQDVKLLHQFKPRRFAGGGILRNPELKFSRLHEPVTVCVVITKLAPGKGERHVT